METLQELQRRVESRKTREKNLEARRKKGPQPNTRGRRPNQPVGYRTLYAANTVYIVKADSKPITFFGGIDALGLAAITNTMSYPPRGYHPAQIRATVGREQPAVVDNKLAGGKRLEYRAVSTAEAQATYTAPISAATAVALKTTFLTVAQAKAGAIGEYGRVDFIPERPDMSFIG